MTIKRVNTVLFLIALATALMQTTLVTAQPPETNYWALIVSCDLYPVSIRHDAQYLYHILTEHYKFDAILYLDCDQTPGVDGFANRDNLRWAITQWLHGLSDANDVILIFIIGHGGGYNTIDGMIEGGRIDGQYGDPADEGPEHYATDYVMDDFGGFAEPDTWFGVDEALYFDILGFEPEVYWDDELAADLDTLSYSTLIFIREGCANTTAGDVGCFSGGLIDDISAPNRIIMTDSNETYYGISDIDGDGFSEWTEAFFDALHGEDTFYDTKGDFNPSNDEIGHTGVRVDADFDNDGYVSMWEAWQYAWNHDTARTPGVFWNGRFYTETPWFDDDGDGLPTYINGAEQFDPSQGDLAKQTFLVPKRLLWDVNGDNYVGPDDVVAVAKRFGAEPGDPNWDPRCDVNSDGYIGPDDVVSVAKHFSEA